MDGAPDPMQSSGLHIHEAKRRGTLVAATVSQACTFFLIGLNLLLNTWVGSGRGPLWLQAMGQLLTALHVWCLLRCVSAPYLAVPEAWYTAAAEGKEAFEECKKTERRLPPRAYTTRGQLVLGFDHSCAWVGVVIGLHNRRYFVQYLLTSALLCFIGGVLSVLELRSAAEAEAAAGGAGSESGAWERVGAFITLFSPGVAALLRHLGVAASSGHGLHIFLACADFVVAAILALYAAFHVHLILHNSTMARKEDTTYDVGASANWAQVFGSSPLRWLLPLDPDGTENDGLRYPQRKA